MTSTGLLMSSNEVVSGDGGASYDDGTQITTRHPYREPIHGHTHVPIETALGIILMVVQTFMSLSGVTLQRLSHVRTQEVSLNLYDAKGVRWYKRPSTMWWIGFTLFLSSQFLMPAALAFAPMSLLAPLSSVQILINLFLAHFILHETITRCDLLATVMCGGFSVGVLVFGPKKDNAGTTYVTDIVRNMSDAGMVFVMCVMVLTALSFLLYIARRRLGFNFRRHKYFLIPWLHCSLAAFGILFTKGIGEQLLALEHNTTGEWGEPIVHLVVTVLLMCSCSPTSMYFQVKATAEFDMRWFIPVKFALSTVLQIFLGAAAFNEWREVDFDDLGMFILFSFLSIGCVLGISSKNSLQERLDAATATEKPIPDTVSNGSIEIELRHDDDEDSSHMLRVPEYSPDITVLTHTARSPSVHGSPDSVTRSRKGPNSPYITLQRAVSNPIRIGQGISPARAIGPFPNTAGDPAAIGREILAKTGVMKSITGEDFDIIDIRNSSHFQAEWSGQ